MKFTDAQMNAAHREVAKKLAWVPNYSSKDEIICALRQLCNKLQAEVTKLKKAKKP